MADDKSKDNVIRFPGGEPAKAGGKAKKSPAEPITPASVDPSRLSEDQRKAISIVLSGLPFVLVGIQPTDSGADFFTTVAGPDGDLRNALPHLASVIERAYERKGLT